MSLSRSQQTTPTHSRTGNDARFHKSAEFLAPQGLLGPVSSGQTLLGSRSASHVNHPTLPLNLTTAAAATAALANGRPEAAASSEVERETRAVHGGEEGVFCNCPPDPEIPRELSHRQLP